VSVYSTLTKAAYAAAKPNSASLTLILSASSGNGRCNARRTRWQTDQPPARLAFRTANILAFPCSGPQRRATLGWQSPGH
jgi:hypothetical protein